MFEQVAKRIVLWTGHASVMTVAAVFVLLWLVSGPWFGFSDTWQLVINTSTTIITFLMVFVIQAAQNMDTREAKQNNRDQTERLERIERGIIDGRS